MTNSGEPVVAGNTVGKQVTTSFRNGIFTIPDLKLYTSQGKLQLAGLIATIQLPKPGQTRIEYSVVQLTIGEYTDRVVIVIGFKLHGIGKKTFATSSSRRGFHLAGRFVVHHQQAGWHQ